MKAHLLFEQSGTFKNAFRKNGIEAYDYDILNDFGETDYQIDLFGEIQKAYEGGQSVFDNIAKDDICFAFFPCVRFSIQIELEFRAGSYQGQMWSDEKNLEYDIKLHKERDMLYEKICQLAIVAIRKKIKMIIENPYSERHYLTQYWCLKPSLIDNNRQLNGDYYKKPTQYFFLNCKPKNNVIFEALEYVEPNKIKCGKRIGGNNIQVSRSMIHPQYADRFIRQQILEADNETKLNP